VTHARMPAKKPKGSLRRPKKPRALILGISGQDGAYLAKLLLEKDYEVHGSSRDHESTAFVHLENWGLLRHIRLHSVSLKDFRSVLTTLQKVNPVELYNLAGPSSVGLSFQNPVDSFEGLAVGTLNILECLRVLKHPARFYQAGTSECFGETIRPADENTPFRPRSPYAVAKAAAHYAVSLYREAYGLFACSGILFNHESPLRPERFVTQKIVAGAVRIYRGSREKIRLGNLEVRRDWGWAPDYVELMWRMLQAGRPRDFIAATGESHSLREFVEAVFCEVGLDWRDHVSVDPLLFRPADILRSSGNPSAALRCLGWRARLRFRCIIKELVQARLSHNEI
jgi:GDPmannose 4,6-dehydratase